MTSKRAQTPNDSQASGTIATQHATEQRQWEIERADKAELAWTLLNASPVGIALIRPDGTIVLANEKTCRQYEEPLETLIGTSIWERDPPNRVNHRRAILRQVVETGQPIAVVDQCGDTWNEILFHPVCSAGSVELVATYTQDITERITAEEQLKRVMLRLVTAQEDERRRISQDLHDDVGQGMTALLLGLKAIERGATAGENDVVHQIEDVIRMVETLAKRIRQVFYQLRPPSLEALTLPEALEAYCASFALQTGLHIDFCGQDDLPAFSNAQATALYRLLQEGLNNVAKHARATSVWISLDYSEGKVSLSIEDNGRGFDPKAISGGMGLPGIRDRLAMLNGNLDLESAPGKGTRLIGSIPIAAHGR